MSRMIRFHSFGAADVLRMEEQGAPSPAAGELQLRVEAIGVSWYDVLWRQNLAPSKARLPAGIGIAASQCWVALGGRLPGVSMGVAGRAGSAATPGRAAWAGRTACAFSASAAKSARTWKAFNAG